MIWASTFSSANDFFNSSTWSVIQNLLIFMLAVFYVALVASGTISDLRFVG